MTAPEVPTLYHGDFMCSSVVYQTLCELSVPRSSIDVKEITYDVQQSDALIGSISPRRVLPVLLMPCGTAILEHAAITIYILSKFDVDYKFLPKVADCVAYAKCLQGIVYVATEGFAVMSSLFPMLVGMVPFDKERYGLLKKKWETNIVQHLVKELDDGRKDYYLGEDFSAADISFSFVLAVAHSFEKEDFLVHPVLNAYFKRLKERDAFKQVYGDATRDFSGIMDMMQKGNEGQETPAQ